MGDLAKHRIKLGELVFFVASGQFCLAVFDRRADNRGMDAGQSSEPLSNEQFELQCEQNSAERWNRLYPIGTPVRFDNREGCTLDTITLGESEVYALPRDEARKYGPFYAAAVRLQGIERPAYLNCCFPKLPKELEFLLESYSAQHLRDKFEHFRDDFDITAALYMLATSWSKYEAPKRNDEEAEIYRKCAKQLRQRADWVKDELVLYLKIRKAVPHLLPEIPIH